MINVKLLFERTLLALIVTLSLGSVATLLLFLTEIINIKQSAGTYGLYLSAFIATALALRFSITVRSEFLRRPIEWRKKKEKLARFLWLLLVPGVACNLVFLVLLLVGLIFGTLGALLIYILYLALGGFSLTFAGLVLMLMEARKSEEM